MCRCIVCPDVSHTWLGWILIGPKAVWTRKSGADVKGWGVGGGGWVRGWEGWSCGGAAVGDEGWHAKQGRQRGWERREGGCGKRKKEIW